MDAEFEKTCSVCHTAKPIDQFYKKRRFPLCKPCGRAARASGNKVQVKASCPEDVSTIKDFIDYSCWRLGCFPRDYRANLIILKYADYELADISKAVEWCLVNGKHPQEPWKVLFWVDEYLESKITRTVSYQDPVERKLQEIYDTANPDLRKKIRAVAGKPDKSPALALLREIVNG